MFDAKAQEEVGSYVYGLFEPDRHKLPFYIGKGKKNRVYSHVAGKLPEEAFERGPMPSKSEVIARLCLKTVF